MREDKEDRIKQDMINHPEHYTWHPNSECIDIAKHFSFCLGNAITYIWRCNHKGNKVEDLRKAIRYLEEEIKKS